MKPVNRRGFLVKSAGNLIKLSGGLWVAGQALSLAGCGGSTIIKDFGDPLDESVFNDFPIPEITPVSDFYVQSKDSSQVVSIDDWRLEISGAVDNPLSLSYQDLLEFEQTTLFNTLVCIGNEVGGGLTGHCEWSGVRLKTLLERAGVRPDAVDVALFARDSYSDSFPVSKGMEEEVILALRMNGEPLTADHGFPVRAIVPNIYGMKNVKWIDRIEALTYDYTGYWQERGWSETAEIRTYSIIQWPVDGSITHPALLAGVAYAGDRGVSSVQVSFDGGSTWDEALVKPARDRYSWSLWAYKLKPSITGRFSVRIRAVERNGEVQGAGGVTYDPKPDGSNGYHQIDINVI